MKFLKQNYKSIIKYFLCFLAFLFLCKANIGSVQSPFAYALFFALMWCGFKIVPLTVLFSVASLVNGVGTINIVNVCCVIFVGLLVSLIHFKFKKPFTIVLLTVYLIISQAGYLTATYLLNGNVVFGVVSVCLGVAFFLSSANFLSAITTRGLNHKLTLDESICAGVFLCVLAIGLSWFSFAEYFLVKFVAIVAILFITFTFTNLIGIISALSFGIGVSLFFNNISYVSVFALYALTVMSFKNEKRVFSVLALVITELVLCFYFKVYNTQSFVNLLPVALGGALFLSLPKNLSERVYNLFGTTKENIMLRSIVNRSKDGLCRRMTELSAVFSEMNCVFKNMVKGVLPVDQAKEMLINEIKQSVCGDCPDRNRCHRTYALEVESILKNLLNVGFEKGRVTIVDVPSGLSTKCAKINILLTCVNNLLENYRQYVQVMNSMDSSRVLIADQLSGVSNLLLNLAEETNRTVSFDYLKEEKIVEELSFNNIVASQVIIYEQDLNEFNVSVIVRDVDLEKDIKKPVSKVIGTRMFISSTEPTGIGGFTLVNLKPAPNYDVAYGSAGVSKFGEKISGDTHSAIRLSSSKVMFALCDGMGSGEQAEKTSNLAISLIENFYKAGFDNDIILSSANKLLTIKNEEKFSAMDICVIDLNQSLCDLIKIGSSLSLVKRAEKIEAHASNSLPLGILEDMRPSISKLVLNSGEFVVLATDGVVDSFSSSEFYSEFVNNVKGVNPQEIAENILNKAIENDKDAPRDDMTVMVLRVFAV